MAIPPNIKDDFPILATRVHGKPLVYLDSSATTQKPRPVLEALERYYRETNANVHRGVYYLAAKATEQYEEARGTVAAFVGARPEELVFTRGTTEAINLVAYAWGRGNVGAGDEIVVTEMEHHSNLVPWQLLAAERGATIRAIPITDEGRLDLRAFDDLLTPRAKVVAVAHQSNVLGTINPIRQISDRAHDAGAVVVVDGAQSVPHMPVNVRDLGCDFLAFSGHKMLGPTGIGALWGRYDLLDAMPPFHGGGEMISHVEIERSTFKEPPHRFEAGTPNIADAIALGATVDYLRGLGMDAVYAHDRDLVAHGLDVLRRVDGLRILGPTTTEQRGAALSFVLEGIHPHDVAQVLDQEGIAVRAGHHCAQPLHRRLGVGSSTRASVYVYNTRADLDTLGQGLVKVRDLFTRVA